MRKIADYFTGARLVAGIRATKIGITSLLACCSLFAAAQSDGAGTGEGMVFDRPVRYVNQSLITMQDVQQRIYENLQMEKRKIPKNPAELKKLDDRALRELTHEELVLQEADRLGLEISERMINEDIRERMQQAKQEVDLATLAELAKRQMRNTRIQVVVRHYLQMAPSIRPLDIKAYYDKNIHQYRRPARWHLFQIVVAPADAQQKERVFNGLLAVYRAVKDNQHPKIKDLLEDESVKKIATLEFACKEQIECLRALCEQVHNIEVENSGAVTKRLQEQAKRWHIAAEKLRDAEQVTALLESVRTEMKKIEDPEKRLHYFTQQADTLSMGLGAGRGGDMSYVEKESQNESIQQQLEKIEIGIASEIVWFKGSAFLLYVSEKEAAVQRSFSDVSGEILKVLEKRQRVAVRHDIERQLLKDSSIVDVEL